MKIRWFAIVLGLYAPMHVHAMGSILHMHQEEGQIVRCGIDAVTGTFLATESRYRLVGKCNVFYSTNVTHSTNAPKTSTFGNEKLVYVAQWNADGAYNPLTKETREVITVYKTIRVGADRPGSDYMGKITNSMICAKDPWRERAEGLCSAIRSEGNLKDPDNNMNELRVRETLSVPRTSLLHTDQRMALNQQYERSVAIQKGIRQTPATSAQITRRENPAIAGSKTSSAHANSMTTLSAKMKAKSCRPGFVTRLARPTDDVCVTPASRERVAKENAAASSLRDPKGAYGPNTCVTGYVWREAFAGDVVCVKPEIRTLVRQENVDAAKNQQP